MLNLTKTLNKGSDMLNMETMENLNNELKKDLLKIVRVTYRMHDRTAFIYSSHYPLATPEFEIDVKDLHLLVVYCDQNNIDLEMEK